MAKRKAAGRKATSARTKSTGRARRSGSRPKKAAARKTSRARKAPARSAAARKGARAASSTSKTRRQAGRKAAPRKKASTSSKRSAPAARRQMKPAAAGKRAATPAPGPKRVPRLDRERRQLDEPVPTPPSSLDLNRHGSAVRTGRAEMAEARADLATMSPAITGGDVDADLETAYFSGDEAPGGDNPTPDQDIVDDIGRALGVEYQDNEELQGADKVSERDKHRWELDPASSEDYRERK